jgi:adenylate cyclase
MIPFISERARTTLANEYVPAADFKAFALNIGGFSAYVTGQPSEEAAKSAAVEQCQKRADAAQSPRKCELYAAGNAVVYVRGKPPMPPPPWVRRDPATERPFVAENVPLTRDAAKTRLENIYVTGRKIKALALAPGGQYFITLGVDNADEAVRRSLESCGGIAGVPCMIVAVDDSFVVAIPTTMKVTGFFKAAGNSVIAPDARDDVERKFTEAQAGWNAIAVGAAGRPGLGLKANSEQAAINQALAADPTRDISIAGHRPSNVLNQHSISPGIGVPP